MSLWRLLNYQSDSAFANMAVDEAVFRETTGRKQPPTLRFYGWRRPSVSIGYFQELKKEINFERCRLDGIDIVRRITGGKAVYHRDEITYALIAPDSEKAFPEDIIRTYEIISLCLARGLSELGIEADLAKVAGPKKPGRSSCCFSVPAGNELLVGGRKICGSAQMRTHGGFLQQGSLMMTFDPIATAHLLFPPDLPEPSENLRHAVTAVNEWTTSPVSPETLCRVLQKGFIAELGIELSEGPLTTSEMALAHRLVKKYESHSWNWERKKSKPFEAH